jgi:membrane protease YdiL (CAAX protease family)
MDTDAALYGPASPFIELPTLSPAGALARQLISYAVLGAAVAALAYAVRGSLPPIGFELSLADLGLGFAGVVAYAAYNAAISLLLRRTSIIGWLGRRNQTIFGKLPLWTMFLMAAIAGVGEEIIFRGWLQPIAGLFVTSALFAVLHFLPNRFKWSHPATWGMIAVYFPVGLAVGWLYLWRGNLLGPIVLHALGDSLGLLFLARSVR